MSETIAAISTAYGEGGIGIVRISGDRALEILEILFRSNGQTSVQTGTSLAFEDRKIKYGHIIEPSSNKKIDEVLAVFMKGPRTYTKEDVVEIFCHGSIVSLRKILELILTNGATLAEPGEFTKRAFLNGRIDLAQADAVIDLIKAKTDKGYDSAFKQLEGSLSLRVNELRDELVDALAEVVVNLDYPDEDEDFHDDMSANSMIVKRLQIVLSGLDALIDTAETGRMIREGIRVVITGKPNVGKSSVLNALLKETRAIVSDIPGTTRDRIEECLSIRGIPLILTDTAGIRDSSNAIEAIGIEMSKDAINKADMIAFILDASEAMTEEDKDIARQLSEKQVLVILNKIDLPKQIDKDDIKQFLPEATFIEMSALTGKGIESIEDHIESAVYCGNVTQGDSLLVTNVRHKNLLINARDETNKAIEMLQAGEALDFVEVDVRAAFDYLGEITGQTLTDDILDRVFSRFCVGK